MTKYIVIASGKGGVGKTTLAINLATAINKLNRKAILVDGSLHTPSITYYLGTPVLENTIHDVLAGKKNIKNSAYRHSSGIDIIPGNISKDALDNVNPAFFSEKIKELTGTGELVIIDAGSGLSDDVRHVIRSGDEILVMTTPDLTSVAEALKTIKVAEEYGCSIMGVVVNRVRNDNIELTVENIESLLEQRVIGVIPEDNKVRVSQSLKQPVVHSHPNSKSTAAFLRLASKLIGHKYIENIERKENMFDYMLRQIGLR